jgi:hypothetical protein
MALLFRNDAIRVIPSALICFKICSGIWLRPELLFALKACLMVCVSSAGVMYYVAVSGVYVSSGIV